MPLSSLIQKQLYSAQHLILQKLKAFWARNQLEEGRSESEQSEHKHQFYSPGIIIPSNAKIDKEIDNRLAKTTINGPFWRQIEKHGDTSSITLLPPLRTQAESASKAKDNVCKTVSR
ncbi:hypothetical protein LOAG_09380 [Loa loa]|uniref:Uncharacterized protein n=1 Tax=Loa loa TaxID=7209 RepID=A0A1S0TS59_LOALO|nr:hypothetical protein LOAG_09380 [Loa loa]EFO19117.1 hypothetical protein LOAG_09380 [Loa loa]